MKIQCQHCASKFEVPAKFYGKRIKCPKCKGAISIPKEPESPDKENKTEDSPSDVSGAAPGKTTVPSEKIRTSCSNCNVKFKAPSTLIGKRVACPKCKSPITITRESTSPKPATKTQKPSATPTEQPTSARIKQPEKPPAGEPRSAPAVATAPGDKIKTSCSNCNATINVPPKLIGKRVACPGCKQIIQLTRPVESGPTTLPPAATPDSAQTRRPEADANESSPPSLSAGSEVAEESNFVTEVDREPYIERDSRERESSSRRSSSSRSKRKRSSRSRRKSKKELSLGAKIMQFVSGHGGCGGRLGSTDGFVSAIF